MVWNVEWDSQAVDDLKSIDKEAAKRIIKYLRDRIETIDDPRRFGKPLLGDKSGLWRYCVGDMRL